MTEEHLPTGPTGDRDRLPARLRDQVADRFPFLLQVALKIGSATAEYVNRFHKSTDYLRQSCQPVILSREAFR